MSVNHVSLCRHDAHPSFLLSKYASVVTKTDIFAKKVFHFLQGDYSHDSQLFLFLQTSSFSSSINTFAGSDSKFESAFLFAQACFLLQSGWLWSRQHCFDFLRKTLNLLLVYWHSFSFFFETCLSLQPIDFVFIWPIRTCSVHFLENIGFQYLHSFQNITFNNPIFSPENKFLESLSSRDACCKSRWQTCSYPLLQKLTTQGNNKQSLRRRYKKQRLMTLLNQ